MRLGTRRSGSNTGRLRAAILELWEQHKSVGALPTSSRFLYYELVAQGPEGALQKMPQRKDKRQDQHVTVALTKLREHGEIPWEDIVDESRSLSNYGGTLLGVNSWIVRALNQYRIDPWSGNVPMIITESLSLAGALRPIAVEYRTRIVGIKGQCGGFLHTDLAPALRPGQPVLYLGDLNFSGGHIEGNTRTVLESKVGWLDWERVALTKKQVEEYKLPVTSKYDARDKKEHDSVETEALRQEIIVNIVRDRLDALLPEPLINVLERESSIRKQAQQAHS